MEHLFEEAMIPQDRKQEDGTTIRRCGTCLEDKILEIDFYKDGKDKDGYPRYRRDCKECYRVTRLSSRRAKREPAPQPKKRGRKK